MIDIKDIFVEYFDISNVNNDKPIIEQLVHIVDKVNTKDIEANTKLMAWIERKYHPKVMEKISSAIALRQVELATKINGVKKILEHIFSLYNKLCNVNFFTQETQQTINRLQGELKVTWITMSTIISNSQDHF